MSRLSVKLDGRPVYLYEFVQGSYDDRRELLYAHVEDLPRAEILTRVRAAVKTLPVELENYDYMSEPSEPDLFEQALTIAGFVYVGGEIPLALRVRSVGVPSLDRDCLEQSLDRFEEEIT